MVYAFVKLYQNQKSDKILALYRVPNMSLNSLIYTRFYWQDADYWSDPPVSEWTMECRVGANIIIISKTSLVSTAPT